MTAARCTVPNGWHCEFYQHRHECQSIKGANGSGISCGDVQEYVPTFSIGGGSLGESGSGSDIGGGISDEFSCSRYQLIEPAELEQCNETAANLVGSVKACHFDEASDTCLSVWPGPGRHDEVRIISLQIAGVVFLIICALICTLQGGLCCLFCCVLFAVGIGVVAAISEPSGNGLYDERGM